MVSHLNPLAKIIHSSQSFIMNSIGHIPQTLLIVVALLSIYIAYKIAHFVLKVVLLLVGLGLLGVAVWWFFFKH